MSDDFVFPEVDEVGIETLDSIAFAHNFNRWMFNTIKEYCSGNILELGSGIGNISKHFIEEGYNIHLTDIRDNYIDILTSNFEEAAKGISKMDVTDEKFDSKFLSMLGQFDSVFALNVVEHIKDDHLALSNASKLLSPGGKLVVLVPAYQWMYNSFDKALEHYRRYTTKSLIDTFPQDLKIVHQQYFNAFGMLGWWLNGTFLKKKTIPRRQMEMYDKLLWVAKSIDIISFNKFGLSVIVVAQKLQ